MAEHWTAEENRTYRDEAHFSGHVIRHNPTPGGRKNADGTTSFGLNFPALVLTRWVHDPAKAAQDIADALNSADAKDQRIAELEAQLSARPAITAGAVERLAKAIHETCCKQDVTGYLDAKLDCTALAQAALAALSPETAEEVPVAGQSGEAVRDCLPPGHRILEQADMIDGTGRVAQTVGVGVENTSGYEEYHRIVHAHEAYGQAAALASVPAPIGSVSDG